MADHDDRRVALRMITVGVVLMLVAIGLAVHGAAASAWTVFCFVTSLLGRLYVLVVLVGLVWLAWDSFRPRRPGRAARRAFSDVETVDDLAWRGGWTQ